MWISGSHSEIFFDSCRKYCMNSLTEFKLRKFRNLSNASNISSKIIRCWMHLRHLNGCPVVLDEFLWGYI